VPPTESLSMVLVADHCCAQWFSTFDQQNPKAKGHIKPLLQYAQGSIFKGAVRRYKTWEDKCREGGGGRGIE